MADIENLPYHRKYRPNSLSKYIGNKKLKETIIKALNTGKRPQTLLLYGNSGCGKAQPLDSLVLTISGFKKMGSIAVGDEVFTHNGNIGTVSGVYPQGVRPIYRINLSDNTYIDVSDEHLNCIWGTDNGIKDEFEVVTTLDLIERLKISPLYIRRDCSEFLHNKINFTNRVEDADLKLIVRIDNIERLEDEECQCIMVDHPDHTYISDYFIPTHNTTIARIIAKEYNCLNRDNETGACGVCPNCTMMDEYIATGNTDLLGSVKEVDIGANSGKGDIDAVLDDVNIPSMGDEWKIYIFDEVQKASEALQTRLLKITEEPPENVLFMLCTTNPEKLLDTLKNRCQIQGHVTKPTLSELNGLLKNVCSVEGVDSDKQGLDLIINRSEFTIRTSLQSLWQVVMEQGSAKYEAVSKVFEEVSGKQLINFFKFLKTRDIFSYVTLISEIKGKMELSTYLTELRNFTVRGVYIANGLTVEGITAGEMKVYQNLFGSMGVAEIGCLLDRLLNMDTNNLELDFLMLGYTGLNTEKKQVEKSLEVPEIVDELQLEQSNANNVIKEQQKIEYEQGVENAEKLSETVGLESLLAMGGSVVN